MRNLKPSSLPWPAAFALIAGTAIRVAALSLPGTSDVTAWKTWSYVAATEGPAQVYGHEFPPARHMLKFAEHDAIADYPPLAIDELALIGRVYWMATDGVFPDGPALTITIRGAIVLMEAALAALLFFIIRGLGGRREAWWAAAAYWVSPAVLLTTTLGYIDVFFALPAVAALVAAYHGRAIAAGVLLAAAVMTKPQALLVAPAVALALSNIGEPSHARARLRAAIAGGTIAAIVLMLPVVFAGTALNMLRALATLARHDMLSGNAANLWWIVSYAIQVFRASQAADPSPFRTLVEIVPISSVSPGWYGSPRLFASLLTLAVMAWAVRAGARARDLGLLAGLAAFLAAAYFALASQAHENHFFIVIPLLVLAATLRREFAPILTSLGIVYALNLYLFYGVGGEEPLAIARTITFIDSTVLLSIAHCAVFGWFARVLIQANSSVANRR